MELEIAPGIVSNPAIMGRRHILKGLGLPLGNCSRATGGWDDIRSRFRWNISSAMRR